MFKSEIFDEWSFPIIGPISYHKIESFQGKYQSPNMGFAFDKQPDKVPLSWLRTGC